MPASKPAPSRIPRCWRHWLLKAAALTALAPVSLVASDTVEPSLADTPDAVIEKWEQTWSPNRNGTVVYHETKHVRLNNDRAYGEFADPRITFDKSIDAVNVIVARVRRPDGQYVEVPKYSINEVSPYESTGWPAFAGIRQLVYTMSGIEPGCVVELEYEITSKPRSRHHLSGDIRLDHRYPVLHRRVQPPASGRFEISKGINPATFPRVANGIVGIDNAPGAPDESQSPPWQERCPRIVFSSFDSAEAWLTDRLGAMESAAQQKGIVKKLAERWIAGITEASARVRAIQERLASTFNFVDFDVAWRPATRSAPAVLQSNYGLPEEAAVAFLSLLRAVGVRAEPAILVSDNVWVENAPQDAGVAAFVVCVPVADGILQTWNAQHGLIVDRARWGGCTLLTLKDGKISRTKIPAWNAAHESQCRISGKITVADNGTYTGKLRLASSGAFVSSEALRTSDSQRSRAEAMVHRVLPDAKLGAVNIRLLTPERFEADIDLSSTGPLDKVDGAYRLALAQDDPAMSDVPMPLAISRRTCPVRITAPFDESIELIVEWPATWKVDGRPDHVDKVAGDWGTLEQTVASREHGTTLVRRFRIERRDIPSEMYTTIRKAVNAMRAETARTLLLRP